MAKQRTAKPPKGDTEDPKDRYPLRIPDKFLGLLEAVGKHAGRKNRSVNLAIVLLLAKAMRDAGLYEPPPDVELD